MAKDWFHTGGFWPLETATVTCFGYVLSISHSNSVQQRGFSISKCFLDIHGNSTKNYTIVALRMVKDQISSVEGIMNVSIYKQLLSSVQSARQRYHCDIEAKRKQGDMEKWKVNKEKKAANLNEKVILINAEIKVKKSGLAVADDCISKGNQKLKNELTSSKRSNKKLQQAQFIISMGLSRKCKLESKSESSKMKTKILRRDRFTNTFIFTLIFH